MKKISALFIMLMIILMSGICVSAATFNLQNPTLPEATAFRPYEGVQLQMEGGNTGYTFEFSGNTVKPAGIDISPTGYISGTFQVSGYFSNIILHISHEDGTSADVAVNVRVKPRPIYVEVIPPEHAVYDGVTAYTAQVKCYDNNKDGELLEDIKPFVRYGADWTSSVIEADTYPIHVLAPSGCVIVNSINETLVVHKNDTAQIEMSDLTVPYDGDTHSVSASVTPESAGLVVEYTRRGSVASTTAAPSAAGVYDVHAYTTNPGFETATADAVLTIEASELIFTVSDNEKEYIKDTPQKATITNNQSLVEGTDYTVVYKDSEGNETDPINAGDYTIEITLANPDAYMMSMTSNEFKITPVEITFTLASESAEYSGSAHTPTINASPEADGLYTFEYRRNGEETPSEIKAVGQYGVFITLTDSNYVVAGTSEAAISLPFEVTKKVITVTVEENTVDYVKDAQQKAKITVSPAIPDSEYTVKYKKDGYEGEYVTNAGVYNIEFTADNYSFEPITEKMTVNAVIMDFTVEENSVPYDGETHKAKVEPTDSSITSDLYEIKYQKGDEEPVSEVTDAGEYRIIITSLNDNYKLKDGFEATMTVTSVTFLIKGNSPAAMIDADLAHSEDTEENIAWREGALESFRANRKFTAEFAPAISGVSAELLQSIVYPILNAADSVDFDCDKYTIIVKKVSAENIASKTLDNDPGFSVNGVVNKGTLEAIPTVKGLYKITYDGTEEVRYVVEIGNKIGDTNANGNVNAVDAAALDSLNRPAENVSEARVWDVNKDGILNRNDADAIRRRFSNPLVPYYPWVN